MKTYTFHEAMKARAEGKRVKPVDYTGFDNNSFWLGSWCITSCENSLWHIETPPTQVPWDCPEDVPHGAAFHCKGAHDRCYPVNVGPDAIRFDWGCLNWKELANDWLHTTDGINWKPCTKESK